MVFRSSPRRRLVVQAEIKPGRPKRQAPKAYGVWSRRLGGQGERRAAICRDTRGLCAPQVPAAASLPRARFRNRGGRGKREDASLRHLESSAAALCSNNLAMPTLQSRGSSPFSNRSAILHLLPLLQPIRADSLLAAPRSSWLSSDVPTSASLPAPLPGATSRGYRRSALHHGEGRDLEGVPTSASLPAPLPGAACASALL